MGKDAIMVEGGGLIREERGVNFSPKSGILMIV